MVHAPGTWLDGERLTVVVGYMGSGKTEFSVNLALALAARDRPVTLADLDVVNPYFRSRERKALLEERGVGLIATSQACVDADLPAMPAELNGLMQNGQRWGVLDIGGGTAGARVLARYRPMLQKTDVRVWLVVNACRPQTGDAAGAVASMEEIQNKMGLKVTGLVNNTHLCGETGVEDVLTGAQVAREVSRQTGIPVICHAVPDWLAKEVGELEEPVFPMDLVMKKPWETGD